MISAKQPDESGEAYLDEFGPGDPWYPIILDAHRKLLKIDPDYTIAQIKEKFGGLRYYYSSDLAMVIPEIRTQMEAVVDAAESQVEALETANRATA